MQLVRAGQHIEERAANRDMWIERRGWNRLGVRVDREAEALFGDPLGHRFSEHESAFETRRSNRPDTGPRDCGAYWLRESHAREQCRPLFMGLDGVDAGDQRP